MEPDVVTIRDVARAAGVSIATVSRVFNDNTCVSGESCRRVRAAAKQLDYWPHSGARSLTLARSQAFGVLLPDLFGEFFSEVIRGLDQAARDHKLQILVSSSHADTEELVTAARALAGRIDGLIAMVPDKGTAAGIQQIARRFPVVLLNPRFLVPGCASVSIANYAGASSLVQHLLGLGHQRIAIVKGPPGNVDAEERLRGYRDTLCAAGVEADPALEFQAAPSRACARGPRRCSLPTTTWPSECWAPWGTPASRSRATWRSPASTTSPSPVT
jgi:LacI family transcriptional regulator